MGRGRRLLGAAGLLGGVLGGSWVMAAVVVPALRGLGRAGSGPASLEVTLTALCAAAAAACWAWLVAATLATAAETLAGRSPRGPRRWVPGVVRVVVALLLGSGVAAPAHALDPGPPPGLDGLRLPDRVATSAPRAHGPARRVPPAQVVRVRPGDSLWSLAAGRLPGACAATLDRAWREIAAANRDLVPDPDVILPGTALRMPDLREAPGKDLP